MWDVFICHASEDKDSVARPLANALREAGLSVWYDEFTLRLGDSLRRSIDSGLANSKYGIVVLSPNFFAKSWPQRELDGLTIREINSGKTILPVWHNVTSEQIQRYSPPLADKMAVSSANGLDAIVTAVLDVIRPALFESGATDRIKPSLTTSGKTRADSFDLTEFGRLVDYAFSSSGLNLPTKRDAADWVEKNGHFVSAHGLDNFNTLVDYAFSFSGLNLSTREAAGEWAIENCDLVLSYGLDEFKKLVDYAFSFSGLNLSTREEAGKWAISRIK